MNNRTSYVLRHGEIVEERWHKVSVGDIVKLKNNDFVAVGTTLIFLTFNSCLALDSIVQIVTKK